MADSNSCTPDPDPGDIPEFNHAPATEAATAVVKHDHDFVVFETKADILVPLEDKHEKTFDNALPAASSRSSLDACSKSLGDSGGGDSFLQADGESERAVKRDVGERPLRYVSPKDFELLKVIGMGAFGKVLQVRTKESKKVLAMKIISKRLLKRKQGYIENVVAERDILTKIRHPFVVNMHCSFQTKEKLFIIMDFLCGGELFLRLGREGIFREKTAAFYLGEIILALDHLHTNGVLHRDLKPENILLDSDGHVCITDFGLARDLSVETGFGNFQNEEDDSRARTVCGTQEYMSPEMLSRKGYGRASDYWSLGCIAYEMLSGRPPFESRKGAKDLFSKIMTEKAKMPDGSTAAACKLLKGLLNRDVTKRWGAAKSTMFEVGGVAGLKGAEFFQHLDWDKLANKEVEPPDSKPVDNDDDLRHFYDEFKQMPLPRSVTEMSRENYIPRRIKSDAFRGFSFVHDDFVLPDRRESEVELYWNQLEEEGESESECASSKMGEDKEEFHFGPEQKKRGPRKRKKKNKVGDLTPEHSTLVTPTQSENGDVTPTLPTHIANDAKDTMPASGSAFPPLQDIVEARPTVVLEAEPPTDPVVEVKSTPQPPKQVWESVSVTKKKQQKQKTPSKPNSTPPNAKAFGLQQQNPARSLPINKQTPPQQSRFQPVQTKVGHTPAAALRPIPTPPRPAPGSWAARAQQQQLQTSKPLHQSVNLPQIPTGGSRSNLSNGVGSPHPSPSTARSTWSGNVLQPPPSPSGDWRSRPLAFNTPITPSRPVRKVAEVKDEQQFWPSLDHNAFPPAGNQKIPPKAAPKGAWARPKA